MELYKNFSSELPFNSAPSTWLHIDINSCFATIEQQANPLWRGKPLVVASYNASYGIALAASREAKLLGIKTGTRIGDAKQICPKLIVVEPDSAKYRFIHKQLEKLLQNYTPWLAPKSIDEFVLDLSLSPDIGKLSSREIAIDIKRRIKSEIGEAITVSIGLAPSRFLAKTAAGIKKPDGLEEINYHNFEAVYKKMPIGDLCGIGFQTEPKLKLYGISTAWDLYSAPLWRSEQIFKSILAYYWYRKLRGWGVEDLPSTQKSIGHSYVMPKTYSSPYGVLPILAKLVDKVGFRLRRAGFAARGISVGFRFDDHSYWWQSHTFGYTFFDTRDIYKAACALISHLDVHKPIRKIAITCFDLVSLDSLQLELFADTQKKRAIAKAMDEIKNRWGNAAVVPARMIGTANYVPDRIAFANSRHMEDLSYS